MSSINTNLSAITALQSLKATQNAMNKNQSAANANQVSGILPPRIVLYDGVCGLCNKAVSWLIVRDGAMSIGPPSTISAYASYSSATRARPSSLVSLRVVDINISAIKSGRG